MALTVPLLRCVILTAGLNAMAEGCLEKVGLNEQTRDAAIAAMPEHNERLMALQKTTAKTSKTTAMEASARGLSERNSA
jgi:hypothetical protein